MLLHTPSDAEVYTTSILKYFPVRINDVSKGVCAIAAGASGTGKTATLIGHNEGGGTFINGAVLNAIETLITKNGGDPIFVCFIDIYLQQARYLVGPSASGNDPTWRNIQDAEYSNSGKELTLTDTGAALKITSPIDFVTVKEATLDRIRVVRATSLNPESSRSHLFMSFGLTEELARNPSSNKAFVFADLAGDEDTKLSKNEITAEESGSIAAYNAAAAQTPKDIAEMHRCTWLKLSMARKRRTNYMIEAEGSAINADIAIMRGVLSGKLADTAAAWRANPVNATSVLHYDKFMRIEGKPFEERVPRNSSNYTALDDRENTPSSTTGLYSAEDQLEDEIAFTKSSKPDKSFTPSVETTCGMYKVLLACRTKKVTVLFGMVKLTGPSGYGSENTLTFVDSAAQGTDNSQN